MDLFRKITRPFALITKKTRTILQGDGVRALSSELIASTELKNKNCPAILSSAAEVMFYSLGAPEAAAGLFIVIFWPSIVITPASCIITARPSPEG